MTAYGIGTPITGSVTHGGIFWDGAGWVNQLVDADNLNPTLVLPTGVTAVTQTLGDTSDAVATDAFVANAISAVTVPALAGGIPTFGPQAYCTTIHPAVAVNSVGAGGSNNGRACRVLIPATGHLRDLYVLINTGLGGNSNLMILDTGQANATHTTRTVLWATGSVSTPSAHNWLGDDPNLVVTAGQTLEFMWAADNATDKIQCLNNVTATGWATLPSTSWLPSSGAGTTSQKQAANPSSVFSFTAGSTITDANWTASDLQPMFIFRIT